MVDIYWAQVQTLCVDHLDSSEQKSCDAGSDIHAHSTDERTEAADVKFLAQVTWLVTGRAGIGTYQVWHENFYSSFPSRRNLSGDQFELHVMENFLEVISAPRQTRLLLEIVTS